MVRGWGAKYHRRLACVFTQGALQITQRTEYREARNARHDKVVECKRAPDSSCIASWETRIYSKSCWFTSEVRIGRRKMMGYGRFPKGMLSRVRIYLLQRSGSLRKKQG